MNARDESEKTPVILCALIDDQQLSEKMLRMLLEDDRTDHDASDNLNRNIFTYAIIKGMLLAIFLSFCLVSELSLNNTSAVWDKTVQFNLCRFYRHIWGQYPVLSWYLYLLNGHNYRGK